MPQLTPRQPVPGLTVQTLDHGEWSLADQKPEHFTLIAFYRGLHCPICKAYLADLDRHVDGFAEKGIGAIAISSDVEGRAAQARQDWRLEKVAVGHSLSLDTARAWGLFVSAGIGTTSAGIEEPELFSEPGLFLVRPDGTLYFSSVQTMPFARPKFDEILKAAEFVLGRDYPARGEA